MTENTPKSCVFCGDQGPLVLHSRCHPKAPMLVELDGDTLIIKCYLPTCLREVAKFKLAEQLHPI